MIFLDIFIKNNVVEIVHKMSALHILYSGILIMDIINHSAWLITSYHMLDAVDTGMFTPCDEIVFTNTNNNTISGVLIIIIVSSNRCLPSFYARLCCVVEL